jgi:hypothetical protein
MEEDNNNNSFPGTWSPSTVLNSCQSYPCCKGTAHAGSRGKEKRPTTDPVDEKSKTNCFDPVCCADDSIKSVLELRICDTNIGKNFTVPSLVSDIS